MRNASPGLIRLLGVLVLPFLSLLGCASSTPPGRGHELAAWSRGAVRWLLLPDEWRALQRVDSHAEAIAFIEVFWRRRDEDVSTPGNAFRDRWLRRVEAADQLYGEGEIEGSLSDRGRALILLGPPMQVDLSSKPALEWGLDLRGEAKPKVRKVKVEKWGYSLNGLPDRLAEIAAAREELSGEPLMLTLTFVGSASGVRLVEGELLLELGVLAGVPSLH